MKISKSTCTTFLFFAALLLLPDVKLVAQNINTPDDEQQHGDGIVTPVLTAPCMGLRNIPTEDLNWQPLNILKHSDNENSSPDEKLMERIKAEKQKIKDRAEQQRDYQTDSLLSATTATPVLKKNFAGNLNNGGTPLDNCIAISDGGIIVSVANTTFRVYDSAGTLKYNKSVISIINDAQITTICDVYVVYDRTSDRFIAFAEVCTQDWTKSRLLLLFSKSNNPATDGWWLYKLPGNPIPNQNNWFDYPKIAVTGTELYISGNLYLGTSFQEAAVWQIRKSDGYSGNTTLTYQVWYGFTGSPFTLCPVGDGQGGAYGPGCYMVSSKYSGASAIGLYQITNDIGGVPSAQVIYNSISSPAYSPPGNASQKGTTSELKINDSRIMNGFYLNGLIHFVFNTDYNGTGYSGIFYGRLNVSGKTLTSKVFGTSGFDLGYPSVSSFATASTDKSVMIGYGRTGSSIYPEIRVVNCDDGMNWSGDLLVKSSTVYIYDGLPVSRWGDYTGTARWHNSSTPAIWMNGMVNTNTDTSMHFWNTWIAEIGAVGVGINEVNTPLTGAKVFPNPVSNTFQMEFNMTQTTDVQMDVYDAQGNLVKDLYRGNAYQGDNVFSFNKSNLSKGIYFLTVRCNSGILRNEKIVVTD